MFFGPKTCFERDHNCASVYVLKTCLNMFWFGTFVAISKHVIKNRTCFFHKAKHLCHGADVLLYVLNSSVPWFAHVLLAAVSLPRGHPLLIKITPQPYLPFGHSLLRRWAVATSSHTSSKPFTKSSRSLNRNLGTLSTRYPKIGF